MKKAVKNLGLLFVVIACQISFAPVAEEILSAKWSKDHNSFVDSQGRPVFL